MSIASLAKKSGINRSHLQAIESGAPNLRVSTMLQLVRVFDTTIAELMRGLERAVRKGEALETR